MQPALGVDRILWELVLLLLLAALPPRALVLLILLLLTLPLHVPVLLPLLTRLILLAWLVLPRIRVLLVLVLVAHGILRSRPHNEAGKNTLSIVQLQRCRETKRPLHTSGTLLNRSVGRLSCSWQEKAADGRPWVGTTR